MSRRENQTRISSPFADKDLIPTPVSFGFPVGGAGSSSQPGFKGDLPTETQAGSENRPYPQTSANSHELSVSVRPQGDFLRRWKIRRHGQRDLPGRGPFESAQEEGLESRA